MTRRKQNKLSRTCSALSDDEVSDENYDSDKCEASDDRQNNHRYFVLVQSLHQRVICSEQT